MLDLEDAVPPQEKNRARAMVAAALLDHPVWVRVNLPGTTACAADLDAVAGRAAGIRIPKTESARDVQWVADRIPDTLAVGGVDLQRDLNCGPGDLPTL